MLSWFSWPGPQVTAPGLAPLAVARTRAVVVAIGVGLAMLPLGASARPDPGRVEDTHSDSELLHVPFPGPEVVTEWLLEGLDVWSVHPENGVVMLADAATVDGLSAAGHALARLSPQQTTPRWFACYSTGQQIVERLERMAATYPDLVELVSPGSSWESQRGNADRQLWTARLTNRAAPGPRPATYIVGLHHAREIITPEVALELGEALLAAYATDPDIAWLLDSTEIWITPSANPDGHVKAVARENWRKNTNAEACAGQPARNGNGPGVDLNRNYGFLWGRQGASTDPCNATYRGEAAFSEPESRALADLMTELDPTLVVSLHSYSDLVLYPWGYTHEPAPDDHSLRSVAEVYAAYTGYRPQPSSDLYITSGDTCDWVYGQLARPCLTAEIGSQADGAFWPDCTVRRRLVADNVAALQHLVRLAPDPYGLARGPLVRAVSVRRGAAEGLVTAAIDDTRTGGDVIEAAEVFFGYPGDPGTGLPMAITPRGRGQAGASLAVPLESVPDVRYVLVRARDRSGAWGPIAAGWQNAAIALPTLTPIPSATATATDTPAVTPTPTVTSTPAIRGQGALRLLLPSLRTDSP